MTDTADTEATDADTGYTAVMAAIERVNAAVDAHPGLRRRTWEHAGVAMKVASARCLVDHDGYELEIEVLPTDARKRRHTRIGTSGNAYPSPSSAADELIRCLDFWAKAIV